MEALRALLRTLVLHPDSDRAIINLQRACGIRNAEVKERGWYVFFRLASALGEEVFAGVPLLFWYAWEKVDETEPRYSTYRPSIALNFTTCFFLLVIGQLCKDLLRLPRPTNQKIVRLERQFETEFGLPSTHTMSGLMGLALFLSWHRHSSTSAEGKELLTLPLGTSVGLFVGLLVGLSRLYLGVHSIADVVSGYVLGLAGIFLLLKNGLCDAIDEYVYQSPKGIFVSLTLLLWFITCYPKTNPWSASYATAAQIFGTWFGIATSSWVVFNVESCRWIGEVLAQSSSTPFHWTSTIAVARLITGLIICGIAKVVGKAIGSRAATGLLESGVTSRAPGEESIAVHKLYCVEVPTRVVNYGLLSFSTIIVTPLCWRFFSLDKF